MNIAISLEPRISFLSTDSQCEPRRMSHEIDYNCHDYNRLFLDIERSFTRDIKAADEIMIALPVGLSTAERRYIKTHLQQLNSQIGYKEVPVAVAVAAALTKRMGKTPQNIAILVIGDWHSEIAQIELSSSKVGVRKISNIDVGGEDWTRAIANQISENAAQQNHSFELKDVMRFSEEQKISLVDSEYAVGRLDGFDVQLSRNDLKAVCDSLYAKLYQGIALALHGSENIELMYICGSGVRMPFLNDWIKGNVPQLKDVRAFTNNRAGIDGLVKIAMQKVVVDGLSDGDEDTDPHTENALDLNTLTGSVIVAPMPKGCGYKVSEIRCSKLPFIGEIVIPMLATQTWQKDELRRIANRRIKELLMTKGLEVQVSFTVSADSAATPVADKIYENPKWFNLYVDMGSTNARWIVAWCDEAGQVYEFDEIGNMETGNLCKQWGFDYNKSAAYEYSYLDFVNWLTHAIVRFYRYIQDLKKSYAVNVFWSFPKIEGGALTSDFNKLTHEVNKRVEKYGLRGRVELVPESLSIAYMFRDRVIDMAELNDAELTENAARYRTEQENLRHNELERDKARERESLRDMQRAAWKRAHKFKAFFGCTAPSSALTPQYNAHLKPEDLGRENLLHLFRNTGARADGQFPMLILDAGGSTLDYCYFVANDASFKNVKYGSFLAGGRDVTEKIMKSKNFPTFDDAESWKRNMSKSKNPDGLLLDTTRIVYQDVIDRIKSQITGDPPCVVATGWAMLNSCLQNMVSSAFMKEGQLLIWSPFIYENFPVQKVDGVHGMLDFRKIVSRGTLSNTVQPLPAYDVVGGLYFYSKK